MRQHLQMLARNWFGPRKSQNARTRRVQTPNNQTRQVSFLPNDTVRLGSASHTAQWLLPKLHPQVPRLYRLNGQTAFRLPSTGGGVFAQCEEHCCSIDGWLPKSTMWIHRTHWRLTKPSVQKTLSHSGLKKPWRRVYCCLTYGSILSMLLPCCATHHSAVVTLDSGEASYYVDCSHFLMQKPLCDSCSRYSTESPLFGR